MKVCRVCQQPALAEQLDLGPQPVSNRFTALATESEYLHPLVATVCRACGLLQLDDPMPSAEVRPRIDWITYNEPDAHLPDLAARIFELPGLTEGALVLGVSGHDEPVLARLQEGQFARVRRLASREDLDITMPGAGVETLQERLTPTRADSLVARYGRFDVLIARYVLEHAHDPARMLASLCRLIAPGGYLVLEVPDVRRALSNCEYSTLWEEHTCYFTPATLRVCLTLAGLTPVFLHSYTYPIENALVAICRITEGVQSGERASSPVRVADEVERARRFLLGFPERRQAEQAFFARESQRGKIALLGAGHLTCAFLNLFDLARFVTLVVDDHPKKQGLFMPGSHLPIRGRAALRAEGIRLCLMGVRPESEEVVLARNKDFLDSGGQMASLCAGSRYARHAA